VQLQVVRGLNHKKERFWQTDFWGAGHQKEHAIQNLKKAEKAFREMGMDYWVAKTQEVLESIQR
jgi:hypothetical protein